MNDKLRNILESLIPFMLLGVAISLIIGLFIMFSYVLIWGIFIGGILWLVFFIKNFLFPGSKKSPQAEGRVIEHDNKD